MVVRQAVSVCGTLLLAFACGGPATPSSAPLGASPQADPKPVAEDTVLADEGAVEEEAKKCDAKLTRAVGDAIRERSLDTKACYDEVLRRDPCARGKLQIAMRVEASGAVSGVLVESRGFMDAALPGCVHDLFVNSRFPGLSGCANLVLPLNFVPKDLPKECPAESHWPTQHPEWTKGPPACPSDSTTWLQSGSAPKLDRPCNVGELEECQRACEKDGMMGCNLLAQSFMEGRGTAKDRERGMEILESACAGGYHPACANLAIALSEQKPEEAHRAMHLLSRACTAGFSAACQLFAYRLRSVDGTEARECASSLLQKTCDLDVYQSCLLLSGLIREERPKEALELLEGTCDAGYENGCIALGQVLIKGDKSAQKRGLDLLWHYCDSGTCSACNTLGYAHVHGYGVPKDPSKAEPLFRKCCVRDYPNGCDSLADAYLNGWGVIRDPAKASQYYQQACDWGQQRSCGKVDSGNSEAPSVQPK